MEIKGDFLSFKFGNVSSESLGIVVVSDGNRFNENLQPEVKDVTTEVPGMDGSYYFGTTYGNKTIPVSFAFDHMTEVQFRQMRQVFACGQMQELVFSERPYKRYQAKIESPIELSYVCFDEPVTELVNFNGINGPTTVERKTNQTQRIYKGEGTINFICYFPFAKSCYKTLPIPTTEEINPSSSNYNPYVANIDEWKDSSGIFSLADYNLRQLDRIIDGEIDVDDEGNKVDYIKLYNPGDIATGFRMYCPFTTYTKDFILIYRVRNNPNASDPDARWQELARLTLKPVTQLANGETGFLIDTNNGLITGVTGAPTTDISGNVQYFTDGVLYNRFVRNGQFFKIQPTSVYQGYETMIAVINGSPSIQIFYDYLYF